MQDPIVPNDTSWVPHRKVVVGAISGPTIGGYIADLTLPFVIPLYPVATNHDSLTVAYSGLCIAIVGFIASYFTPQSQ